MQPKTGQRSFQRLPEILKLDVGLPLVLWCQFKVSHPVSVLCDFGMPFDFLPLTHSSQPYTTLQLSLIRPLWQRRHAHPIVLSRALSDWMYQNWVFTVAREKSLNTVHFRSKAGSLCRVSNFLTQSVTAHLPPHCTHDLPITTSLLTEKLGHIIFISAGTRAAMLFTTTPLVDNDQIECEGEKNPYLCNIQQNSDTSSQCLGLKDSGSKLVA